MADSVLDEIIAAGGLGLDVVDLGGSTRASGALGQVRLGVHRRGPRPVEGLDAFDILLSADPSAPAPWVGTPDLEAAIAAIADVVERQPVAAAVAAQVHRMTLSLGFDEALALESMAYSMLLASEGFRAWRAGRPRRQREADDGPRVALARENGALSIRLTRPAARNAVDTRMRDEWVEALEFAIIDPDAEPVVLSGEGTDFCAGGDLDAFGTAGDPGRAHAIRTLRSAARLARQLGPRLTVRLQGACIGAGIEVPAAAARVIAAPDARFRLPEVSMGLIPGAGGTASVPRRIGRHRACWLAITGATLDAETALAWGLVDAIEPAP
jgi:enoyl-CoA hydratase/carnithine racemase